MVDVEYQPITKIIVHEAIKHTYDEFVRMFAQAKSNTPPQAVRWLDGIIFNYSAMPATPELINERVRDGAVHWDFIIFAEMPEYQNIVTHPETQVQLRVIDNSNNSAIADVIRKFKDDTRFFPPPGN